MERREGTINMQSADAPGGDSPPTMTLEFKEAIGKPGPVGNKRALFIKLLKSVTLNYEHDSASVGGLHTEGLQVVQVLGDTGDETSPTQIVNQEWIVPDGTHTPAAEEHSIRISEDPEPTIASMRKATEGQRLCPPRLMQAATMELEARLPKCLIRRVHYPFALKWIMFNFVSNVAIDLSLEPWDQDNLRQELDSLVLDELEGRLDELNIPRVLRFVFDLIQAHNEEIVRASQLAEFMQHLERYAPCQCVDCNGSMTYTTSTGEETPSTEERLHEVMAKLEQLEQAGHCVSNLRQCIATGYDSWGVDHEFAEILNSELSGRPDNCVMYVSTDEAFKTILPYVYDCLLSVQTIQVLAIDTEFYAHLAMATTGATDMAPQVSALFEERSGVCGEESVSEWLRFVACVMKPVYDDPDYFPDFVQEDFRWFVEHLFGNVAKIYVEQSRLLRQTFATVVVPLPMDIDKFEVLVREIDETNEGLMQRDDVPPLSITETVRHLVSQVNAGQRMNFRKGPSKPGVDEHFAVLSYLFSPNDKHEVSPPPPPTYASVTQSTSQDTNTTIKVCIGREGWVELDPNTTLAQLKRRAHELGVAGELCIRVTSPKKKRRATGQRPKQATVVHYVGTSEFPEPKDIGVQNKIKSRNEVQWGDGWSPMETEGDKKSNSTKKRCAVKSKDLHGIGFKLKELDTDNADDDAATYYVHVRSTKRAFLFELLHHLDFPNSSELEIRAHVRRVLSRFVKGEVDSALDDAVFSRMQGCNFNFGDALFHDASDKAPKRRYCETTKEFEAIL